LSDYWIRARRLLAHQHHQLQILAMRGFQGDLVVHKTAVARMVEFAPAAFAFADVLRGPEARERIARGGQRVDQATGGRFVQMTDRIRAKLRGEPPCAAFPIDDQRARGRLGEGEAEQIAVVRAVQPADEQVGRALVPSERRPARSPAGRFPAA
jgi:hypothetical protein